MFYSTNITTPYLTTLIAILVNVLTLLTWTKAKAFHVLTVATIFSVLILSIDMTLVLGLSLFAKIGPIDYVPIPQISLVANAFVIAPLIYKGLRYVVQLEEERKYLIIRRLLLILTICCMIVSLVVNIFFEYLPSSFWVRGVDLWMFPFVMILFLFSMLAGTEVLHTQHDRKFKELEYQALQQYTRDVEEQSKEIKSFRHDYMNILLSLESYINESSTEELKEFYYKKLVKTAEPMYKEAESELQQLCNIKDKEIKSILTVKIQKMISAGIQVKFEAVEEIKILHIDTVIMVRIIVILLYNAFEEV
jgi:two-component system sensor histidine kinase AgrC